MKPINMIKLLLFYRCSSLVATSLFYIVGVQQHDVGQRLSVIMGMIITSLVMNYLYLQNKGDKHKILVLIIIETIGNCMILIPSGGLQSPYIWYVFNTIIIAGVELGSAYLWTSVAIYLASMIGISYKVNEAIPITSSLRLDYLNLVTGFVLVAFIIELLIRYTRDLEEQTKQFKQYLDYTMRIYDTVYLFTSQGNKENLIEVIFEYLRERLGISKALFIEFEESQEEAIPHSYGLEEDIVSQLVEKVREQRLDRGDEIEELEIAEYGKGLIGIPIKHTYSTFGVLIVNNKLQLEELKFISYVSGMILKKIRLEKINKELVLSQEQNRIANEIHDSVLQKLFGISCNLFTVAKKVDTLEKEVLGQELKGMRTNLTQAMTELRATIYGLSWNKSGKNNFLERLEGYIQTMKNLHRVDIDMKIVGNIEKLRLEEQKALYRVCCEALSNGIRHGKADKIRINFDIGAELIALSIEDNGSGFNYHQVVEEGRLGLGIKNMQQLIANLEGELRIDSALGKGSKLEIKLIEKLEHSQENIYKEGVI